MKITDVSSAPKTSNEPEDKPKDESYHVESRDKQTLLQRYDIPVEHLDYAYVGKCNDSVEIERILRILRSGEEGTFPDLEKCVMKRLEKLKPNSRLLRVETPVIRTRELDKDDQHKIQSGLEEWLDELTKKSESKMKTCESDIFTTASSESSELDVLTNCELPVRGTTKSRIEPPRVDISNPNTRKKSSERIKSCDYEKWDKYDVDAELTKLDIADMQREEWEKREKPKVIEEQKRIERLMKSTDDYDSHDQVLLGKSSNAQISSSHVSTNSSKSGKNQKKVAPVKMPVEKPSFIEELDDEEGEIVNTSAVFAGSRKATVVIEDLNLAM